MHPNNEYQSCFNNQRKLVSDYQRRKMLFRQIKPFLFFGENRRFSKAYHAGDNNLLV